MRNNPAGTAKQAAFHLAPVTIPHRQAQSSRLTLRVRQEHNQTLDIPHRTARHNYAYSLVMQSPNMEFRYDYKSMTYEELVSNFRTTEFPTLQDVLAAKMDEKFLLQTNDMELTCVELSCPQLKSKVSRCKCFTVDFYGTRLCVYKCTIACANTYIHMRSHTN